MQVDQGAQYLFCILANVFLWQVVVWFPKEPESICFFAVLQNASNLCVVHYQISLVVRTVVDHFVQLDDIWMMQHFMNINFTHRIDVSVPVMLALNTSTKLLHNELFERIVFLTKGNTAIHGVGYAVHYSILVVGRTIL